jgi:hypothetical protein
MATAKISGSTETKDGAAFYMENTDLNAFREEFRGFMTAQGYRLESGTTEKGVYGIGSNVMRILFGAFVKRYSFDFDIKEENGKIRLDFFKNSWSGISGGVIGVQKLKKEMERMLNLIKTTFA